MLYRFCNVCATMVMGVVCVLCVIVMLLYVVIYLLCIQCLCVLCDCVLYMGYVSCMERLMCFI